MWMNAKYSGMCKCGASVAKGERMRYQRSARMIVQCMSCNPRGDSIDAGLRDATDVGSRFEDWAAGVTREYN
jgi:hypothetical protein